MICLSTEIKNMQHRAFVRIIIGTSTLALSTHSSDSEWESFLDSLEKITNNFIEIMNFPTLPLLV